jgi:hypothetical protein
MLPDPKGMSVGLLIRRHLWLREFNLPGAKFWSRSTKNKEGSKLSKDEKIKQAFTAYECGKSCRGL